MMKNNDWQSLKSQLEDSLNDPQCPFSKAKAARFVGFEHRSQLWDYLFNNKASSVPSYDLGKKFEALYQKITEQKKANQGIEA